MRVLRATGGNDVEVIDIADPTPGPDEALIAIEASALCGSEKGPWRTGMDGAPYNAGHEACGRVLSIPQGAGFSIGDRVAIGALKGCMVCPACRRGQEMFCAAGVGIQLGLHAERAVVHPSTLRALPAGTEPGVGALIGGDALGVPVRALNRIPSVAGDRVIVIGLGPVGLSHVLVRSHVGADVIAVDPNPYRRSLASQLGAVAVAESAEDVEPADLVIEATGIPSVIATAFAVARPAGTVLQSGECGQVEIHPSRDIIHRELAYVGTWFYGREDYPRMLDLVGQGLDVAALLTHEFAADQATTAVGEFIAGATGKAVIRWS